MFLPPLIAQLDGTPFAGLNCGLTRTAMAVMDARAGLPHPSLPWPPTGATMRTLSGDTEGGTRLTQHKALAAKYGVDIDLHFAVPFDDMWAEMEAGKGLLLDGSYSAMPDPWRGSATFFGNHGILVIGQTYDPLYDGRRPGIPKGPQPVPKAVLRRFAGALKFSESGTTLGEGLCYAGLYDSGPQTPPQFTVDFGGNTMIIASQGITSTKRMRLPKGTLVFREPGGPRITSMSKDSAPPYIGAAGAVDGVAYRAVLIATSNFQDGQSRRVIGYVQADAGTVS